MNLLSLEDRVRGGLYGVAVGDALGATVEFINRDEIRRYYGVLRDIVGGGWLNLRPGEWTDDTEMTLAVAEGIIADPEDPVPHIGQAFLRWRATNPPDIGNTVSTVFRILDRDNLNQWHIAAERAHRELGGMSAGNGALMRTLPVGIAYTEPRNVYRWAIIIARMTHWDIRAGLTCAVYSLAVRNILDGALDKYIALAEAAKAARELTKEVYQGSLSEIIDAPINRDGSNLKPTGYTVDSFRCAIWAFIEAEGFEDAVVRAVNLGGDADTIGAIAGGLAGVYWGFDAIPSRWLEKFTSEQKARLDRAAEGLLKVRKGCEERG
ncbi:ADP-ribosyl-[dinitrogen reductase] hydrolase [Thermanaeromonas toyohensis ToBE]|uniref:ADP-ribosyl-[dinitrogen reductase] hydrolase n=1 Tax=Thermanaeromonas toyohensis ToBE TaxID=698762 RepID=A0A1W1VYS1_9FIRM|nr:ADP-ribosylglycohydrolase family protein [Thermanaeromonas toyohensis]SMB97994.1 ADP-ribosyl-[dinitrogen reductase] hydrolase [Thermanaeromonas toyohensis ToBE]